MVAGKRVKRISLIPLPRGQVLLPGVVLRITVANRPDIAALLANTYSNTNSSNASSSILIGCVPLASSLLSLDGNKLISNGADASVDSKDDKAVNMATLDK